MDEAPEENVVNFNDLTTEELLGHDQWKARKLGYERLNDEAAKDNFTSYHSVPPYLKESNISVFEAVVELIHTILDKNPQKLPINDIIGPICERGLVGRPKVASKSKAILSLLAESGSLAPVLHALLKISSKSPKLKLVSVEVITVLTRAHGVIPEVKDIVPFAFTVINDTDGKVRKEAMQLVIAIACKMGSAVNTQIEQLRDVQKTEIYKALEMEPPQEQKKQSRSPVKTEPEFKPSKSEDIKPCSGPVDVLGSLSNAFYAIVNDTSKKWQERNAALQEDLIPLISFEELKDGDYGNLVRCLRGLLTDSQLPLQLLGIRCIGYLSNGLKGRFAPYVRMVILQLVDKFKEKKTIYLEAVRSTLHTINTHACGLNDIYTELEGSLLSKVPHQRFQTLQWIGEVVCRDPEERNVQCLVSRGANTLKKLQHDDKKDVRDSANALVSLLNSNPSETSSQSAHSAVTEKPFVQPIIGKSPSMKKQRTSLHGSVPTPRDAAPLSARGTPTRSRPLAYTERVKLRDQIVTPDKSRVSISERASQTNRVAANHETITVLAGSAHEVFAQITTSGMLQTMSESKVWKERLQVIRTIEKMLCEGGTKVAGSKAGVVLMALKSRLDDTNRNIVAEVLKVIAVMFQVVSPSPRSLTKLIVPVMVPLLKDQKVPVRESAKHILELSVAAGGLEALQPCLPWGLQTDSSVTTLKLCELMLQGFESGPTPPPRVLLSYAPAVLKALLNRSIDLRTAAERLIPHLVSNAGYDAVHKVAYDFKNIDQQTLLGILKRYNSGAEQRLSQPRPVAMSALELPTEIATQYEPIGRQARIETMPVQSPRYRSVQYEEVDERSFHGYITPVSKKEVDEEPIGRLSAKFEHSVVVSGNDTFTKSHRKVTPSKMVLPNSPMQGIAREQSLPAPASHSLRESCQVIKCGTIEQAMYQCREWARAFQAGDMIPCLRNGCECARLIQAVFYRLNVLMDNMAFHGIEAAFCFVYAIEEILKRPDYVWQLDESHVSDIFAALIERILDLRIAKYPNLWKALNALGYYLIDNSILEICIHAVVKHLMIATEAYLRSPTQYNTRMLEFTCKCLAKASERFFKESEFDLEQILCVIDTYFQTFPPYLFEGKRETSITTLRHVISTLVQLKGAHVLDTCNALGMGDTLLYQFIEMSEKNKELSEFMGQMQGTRRSSRSLQSAADNQQPTTPRDRAKVTSPVFQREKPSMPSAEVMDSVFSAVKRMNQTEEGIKDLFKLMKNYPEMDVSARLGNLNRTYRSFVVRRLQRLRDAEIASGIIPEGYVMRIPQMEGE